MPRDFTDDEKFELEALVDSTSIGAVLEMLSSICGEKAEHLRANWGDASSARTWDTVCGLIGVAACHKAVTALER